jgi:RNA polymerase sigma-70 factor, ECF subfamily
MDELAHRIGEEMPRLRRYALALLRSEVDADDDLVQECVLRALSKRHLWQEHLRTGPDVPSGERH